MKKQLLTIYLTLCILLTAFTPSNASIKVYKSESTDDSIINLIAKPKEIHLKRKVRIDRVLLNRGIKSKKITQSSYLIPRNKKKNIEAQIKELERSGLFEYIEADEKLELDEKSYTGIIRHPEEGNNDVDVITNDTFLSSQSYLDIVNAKKAWNYSTGAGIKVAVLDSGIDGSHYEFAGRATGYTNDEYGHGTSVAGIIAATGKNNKGIAGIAYDCDITAVKVIENDGSIYISSIVNGLESAYQAGAKIVQISISTTTDSQTLRDAVAKAVSRGIIIVASGGNTSINQLRYPAGYPGVIGVSSINNSLVKSGFSSYGSHIDITAPGENITTTIDGGYIGGKSGTSFSSPIISGVAALVWSANPNLTSSQVTSIILQTAGDIYTSGRDDQTGYGLVNAHLAVLRALEY